MGAAVTHPNDNIDTRLIGEEGLDQMGGEGNRGSLKISGSQFLILSLSLPCRRRCGPYSGTGDKVTRETGN